MCLMMPFLIISRHSGPHYHTSLPWKLEILVWREVVRILDWSWCNYAAGVIFGSNDQFILDQVEIKSWIWAVIWGPCDINVSMSVSPKWWVSLILQIFHWVMNNIADRQESLTPSFPVAWSCNKFPTNAIWWQVMCRIQYVVLFIYLLGVASPSLIYALLWMSCRWDLWRVVRAFWKRAQVETKPWILDNVVSICSTHKH